MFFYQFAKNENFSTMAIAFIFFPGAVIHELSHFLAAKLMLVPTGKISLLPKREGNYIKLGSVSVAESNILKEFIIGVAPLFVGIIFILSIVYFFLIPNSGFAILKIIISLYTIFVISNTMYASRKDFDAALPFLVSLIILGIVFVVVGIRVPQITLEWLPALDMTRIFYTGFLFLAVPVVIDLTIILLLRIFNRMW